jgi:hypothetical protein
MEKAKRARKAETPKQPSLRLRLRAPYLYPDRAYSAWAAFAATFAARPLYLRELPTLLRCSGRQPWATTGNHRGKEDSEMPGITDSMLTRIVPQLAQVSASSGLPLVARAPGIPRMQHLITTSDSIMGKINRWTPTAC